MEAPPIKIRVRLFAVAREAAGADFVDIDIAAVTTGPANVGALRAAFLERLPTLQFAAKQLLFAVDGDYATDATPLAATSEVACIPPVSGG